MRSRPELSHKRLGDLEEVLARRPAHALHHLGRVARVVFLQELEDTARMLQRRIDVRRQPVDERLLFGGLRGVARVRDLFAARYRAAHAASGGAVHRHALVLPARQIVLVRIGLEAGEDAVEIVGVAVPFVDDHGRIRVAP